jgi:predicted P-loop ATPase
MPTPQPTPTASPPPAQTPTSDIDICQNIIRNMGYDFRLNQVTKRIESFGKKNQVLDDILEKLIAAEVSRHFRVSTERLEIAITELASYNEYHPIKQYLNATPYDGGKHFDNLVSCFTNPDGLFSKWLYKWMLGSVAKVMAQAQNPMLVLNGPQGVGKSKFVQWLCKGVPSYFVESGINTGDKDTYDLLSSRWIWEVSELGASIRRSDMEALKHFITMGEVTMRVPYARHAITRPAMASLIGTINDPGGGIFNDPTGSRRFLICDITSINWQEYIKIDVNQLWAEIYVAYLGKADWELTPDDRILQEKTNIQYQPRDTIEDHIKDGFEIDISRINDPDWFVSSVDLIEYLQVEKSFKAGITASLERMIAQSCKSMGLKEFRQDVPSKIPGGPDKQARGYRGIKKL